jgi:hypothetical protein
MVAVHILVLCAAQTTVRIKGIAVHPATIVVILPKPVKNIWTNFHQRNRKLKRTTSKVFDAGSFNDDTLDTIL